MFYNDNKILLLIIVSVAILTLLWLSISELSSNIQPVKANGTIYIRADGSVDPPDASISSFDNITYTLIDNINDSIVVERSNIILDGDGYTIQRNGSGNGFYLYDVNHVTIKDANIKGFYYGIHLNSSFHIVISGNNITANTYDGIRLSQAYGNTISGNNITANSYDGIKLWDFSDYNVISENNITANNDDGIQLYECSSNLVSGNNITANNDKGVHIRYSSNNSIYGNIITNNQDGIYLHDDSSPLTSYNNIYGNNITANNKGIHVYHTQNNFIYLNNFQNKKYQIFLLHSLGNVWDNGYPFGGNYWSNYTGADIYGGAYQNETGSDGLSDTPYIIYDPWLTPHESDKYPLLYPVNFFKAEMWNRTTYYVYIVSNSSVSGFRFTEHNRQVSFNISSQSNLTLCRVTIPRNIMWCDEPSKWNVTVNDNQPNYQKVTENDATTFLYFTYNCTYYNVKITSIYVIPEFP